MNIFIISKRVSFELLLVIIFLIFSQFSTSQIPSQNKREINSKVEWPTITETTKPRAWWWWMGSALNKMDITWNMEQYARAGLGGFEIVSIYGVHDYEKQFIKYLSPQWVNILDFTLKEAKRLNLGIDMSNSSGWIFGGPWIGDKDASKTIVYKTYFVHGGERLQDTIGYYQEAQIRTANNKHVSIEQLVQPVVANKDLPSLALDKVKFPQKLPLHLLMAYGEDGSKRDITNKVDVSGKLNWLAPKGNWKLYALFLGMHGKMVERPGPGGEGYAVDPFSKMAMRNYFKKFDEVFKGNNLSQLRSFCNDSYELDDEGGTSSQANWTPLFLSEFRKRRGYDLQNFFPALFQSDSVEINKRVIYDYRMTIDELLLENFTLTWKNWVGSKGKLTRNQAHGSPGNILDLYSAADIPDAEGSEIMHFKYASSASHVTGKKLTSSETVTWLNEHFQSSWRDVKKALDPYFLGGINHIYYHGIAYSPEKAPWPGWLFYASVHFQPTNPQWKDFHALNDYVTKCQSFLQRGKADNDVLLYFPLADRYSDPGSKLLRHFHPGNQEFAETDFKNVSDLMLKNGYSFDFFSDRQLMKISTSANRLQTGGISYKAILLPANKLMSQASFQKLVELAKNGAQILVYKNLPEDVPGLANLEERRNIYHQLINQLHFVEENKVKKATIGKGVFILSNNVSDLLEAAEVRRERLVEKDLQYTRRKNSDGYTYFIANRNNISKEEWIPLSITAASVALFDPASSANGMAKYRKDSAGRLEVLVQLQPFGSCIVRTFNMKQEGKPYPYINPNGFKEKIQGSWTIEFTKGGPVLPGKQIITSLGSWTDLAGDDVKRFSGTARYSINFTKPEASSSKWILDLGQVNETAEVFINRKRIATLIGPVYQVVVDDSLLQKENTLEVYVSNLMANRIIDMDKQGIEWKKFYDINFAARDRKNKNKQGLFDASEWKPMLSGLTGPVSLLGMK
ncbi:MAG TPA: glycosyl hydrolase [Flavitalea sp.]|nr:glycosyl hydrolase [Flavitalea sp.]